MTSHHCHNFGDRPQQVCSPANSACHHSKPVTAVKLVTLETLVEQALSPLSLVATHVCERSACRIGSIEATCDTGDTCDSARRGHRERNLNRRRSAFMREARKHVYGHAAAITAKTAGAKHPPTVICCNFPENPQHPAPACAGNKLTGLADNGYQTLPKSMPASPMPNIRNGLASVARCCAHIKRRRARWYCAEYWRSKAYFSQIDGGGENPNADP